MKSIKTLLINEKSAKLVTTVLKNEIYLLEFNIKNGEYSVDEKEEVMQEIYILNSVIEQLKEG